MENWSFEIGNNWFICKLCYYLLCMQILHGLYLSYVKGI